VQSAADASLTRSVERACDILVALAEGRPEMGVTDVSRATHLGKSTVFRLLQSLMSRGLVAYNRDTQCYRLGAKALELGLILETRLPIRNEAMQFLEQLRDLTGETATLYLPIHRQVIPVVSAVSELVPRRHPSIGTPLPFYAGAIGKVAIAFHSGANFIDDYIEEFREILTSMGESQEFHTRLAGAYGGDLAAYHVELLNVRERGYATAFGQYRTANSLAFPLLNADEALLAGISITGPEERWTGERMEACIPQARAIVEDLALRLRYMQPFALA
jgi:DNA-binding IclR family transcriptional regulator